MKHSIISTILLLQNAIQNDYAKFTFEDLVKCDYDNLESIRDCKLSIYNQEKKHTKVNWWGFNIRNAYGRINQNPLNYET